MGDASIQSLRLNREKEKNMKKLGKKLMALVVALAMIATVIPVVNAEADSVKIFSQIQFLPSGSR